MSLEQVNVLDYVSVNKESGHVVLSISDDLDWDDQQRHLLLLQDKSNFYFGFIESDQIYTDYPDAKGRENNIGIYYKNTIPEVEIDFFNKVKALFKQSGYNLWVKETIPSSDEWLDVF